MEEIKEIAECCICTDLFTDPRMLPCLHTFCLNCLNQTTVKAGDSMPCPLCRSPFVVPSEGMIGLPKNFFMKRLVEVAKISRPSSKLISCEICIELKSEEGANEIPSATLYCIQ